MKPVRLRRIQWGVRSSLALLVTALMTLGALPAGAETTQRPPERGSKARVLGTVIGAAAGFGLGLAAGLTWFDDAVNSDRKVWTTAIGFAGAGGAAGYVIGRSVDRRPRRPIAPAWRPRPGAIDVPRTLEWREWPRDMPRAR